MKWCFYKDYKFWLLVGAVVIFWILNLIHGRSSYSAMQIFDVFFGNSSTDFLSDIVFKHRMPKTIAAALAGICLSVSGWVLQEFFRNPLAGPSVLGISSSAGLGVALYLVIGVSMYGFAVSPFWLMFFSFVGALGASLLVVILSFKIKSTAGMVILGFMISALCGAVVSVLQFFASAQALKSYVIWGMGSITGLDEVQLWLFFVFTLLGVAWASFHIKGLMGLQLGELYAQTMGVQLDKLRLGVVISSSLLTAVCTAFVGPLVFVGLAVPHLCRMLLKTANFYQLFCYVVFSGMLVMLMFSLLAEMFPIGVLPINVIAALFGAPVIMGIVLSQKRMYLNG